MLDLSLWTYRLSGYPLRLLHMYLLGIGTQCRHPGEFTALFAKFCSQRTMQNHNLDRCHSQDTPYR